MPKVEITYCTWCYKEKATECGVCKSCLDSDEKDEKELENITIDKLFKEWD